MFRRACGRQARQQRIPLKHKGTKEFKEITFKNYEKGPL